MRPAFLRVLALAILATLVLVLFASGCGRSSLEPELLDGGATRVDGGPQPGSCGPATCPGGCCDANGTCRSGHDPRACGSVGERCSDCVATGFTFCNAAGVCGRSDPSCGPSSCDGCCDVKSAQVSCLSGTQPTACGNGGDVCSNCASTGRVCDISRNSCSTVQCDFTNCAGCCVGNKCLSGDSTSACGNSGFQCSTCSAGQSCTAQSGGGGECTGTAKCGPDTCKDGCCDAAGRCVSGNDTTACGAFGGQCTACGPNQVCFEQICQALPTCDANSCAGCCVGDQCVDKPTAQACGIKGLQCKTCNPGESCDATGNCVPGTTCGPCSTGCCVGDICAQGTQTNACGSTGDQCVNCANVSPGSVCQNGKCVPPTCTVSCVNGCCSGNTCVSGTQDDACGLIGGTCSDCTATAQTCNGGKCVTIGCGPGNCPDGCCRNGSCEDGTASAACGTGGGACMNCQASGSFCNGLVTPRRCNNQQNTCPADYGACAAGPTPVQPLAQKVCSAANLSGLAVACVNGPDSPTCQVAFARLSAACQKCLTPFDFPYDENAGLYACAASSLSNRCRQATGCAADCSQTSCDGCSSASRGSCFALVDGIGGQCRNAYLMAQRCTNDALRPGQPCSQFTYPDFGAWFRSVGDRFCGDGP